VLNDYYGVPFNNLLLDHGHRAQARRNFLVWEKSLIGNHSKHRPTLWRCRSHSC
jgi:hypothetical protein